MSLNVNFNGGVYIIPETGEVGWGGNTTSYLVAIAAGALQKTGGSFTLSADTDFGASFGLMSLYYKSRSSNIATAGILRLNNNSDAINWRNAANSANLPLLVNTSDQLVYNGNPVLTGSGPSAYVSSITGTANQVNASASTGAVTLSLPQSIATSSAVQFGTLGLGSAIETSAILSMSSTTAGLLMPRMTTTQRDAIATPATGLEIFNTSTGVFNYYNGSAWVAIAAGGTINAGTQYQLAYYAANGTTLSGLPLITASRALESDANGLPVASTVTATELGYVSGVTSAIQTQLNGKEPTITILPISKGGTNSGTALNNNRVIQSASGAIVEAAAITASRALISDANGIPTHSTVTSTELGYVSGVTSSIQTQIDTKATDSLVVHLAGNETITGEKTFNDTTLKLKETTGSEVITISVPTLAADRTVRFPDAGQNSDVVLNEGTQTINGTKTITALVGTLAADLNSGNNKVTNLAAATANGDAVRFQQLKVIQVVNAQFNTNDSATTSSTFQASFLTASITPTSTSNKVLIIVSTAGENSAAAATAAMYSIFRGTTNLATNHMSRISAATAISNLRIPLSITWLDSPATTSSTTYTLYFRSTDNTTNVRVGDSGSVSSSITLIEVAP